MDVADRLPELRRAVFLKIVAPKLGSLFGLAAPKVQRDEFAETVVVKYVWQSV